LTFIGLIAVVIAAFALAYLAYQTAPGAVSTFVGGLETFRMVSGAVVIGLVVWHFLLSGDMFQVFLGFGALVVVFAYFLVFEPHKEVI